jgi:hypothetical protein
MLPDELTGVKRTLCESDLCYIKEQIAWLIGHLEMCSLILPCMIIAVLETDLVQSGELVGQVCYAAPKNGIVVAWANGQSTLVPIIESSVTSLNGVPVGKRTNESQLTKGSIVFIECQLIPNRRGQ